jgi:hypothetical protein
MRSIHRNVIAAAFLGLGTIGVAAAAEVNLTAQQKQTIVQSTQAEKGQPAPAGFLPRIGTPVPASMSIRPLPISAAAQIPGATELQYAKLDTNEILLVEPKDRKVSEIIRPSGATGAAPSRTSPTSPR